MPFKQDSNKSTSLARRERGDMTAKQGNASNASGGAASFSINRETLVESILPPGGEQLIGEISKGLGIDLLDPKGWTKEAVINAKKLAAELDERMMMMEELMPAIMKFLEFQVSVAEFHAEVMVETYKAKNSIDKAKAKAFVAYYAYLRKAAQLEKRIQATQKHIDAAYSHFESIQGARSNAILSGLNQQARLGEQGIQHQQQMKEQRRDIRAQNSQRRRELREELRVGHLQNGGSQ